MTGGQHKTPVDSKSAVSSASPSSGGAQAFAPLPFDESLVATASSTESTSSTSITGSKSAADFFLDQIAAVVSDEKKLSDNIMDLIPPVEAPVSQAASTQPMTSMSMPLQPPPGLMMRALSPPTSLLPDFGDVAPLSLLGDATVTTTATSTAVATTVTTAVKRELPVVKPAVTGTAAMRRKAELATAASVTHKKQKTENIKPETVVKAAPAVPVSVHQQIQQQTRHLHNNNALTASAAAAAAVAAREKVMKEPQSGDLYECVITKRNGGLGLTLACVDDHVQITGLAPDTPAASSGICVGDTLVAVSGLPVRGLQFSTVIGRLKSTSRNSVVLKLRRNPLLSRRRLLSQMNLRAATELRLKRRTGTTLNVELFDMNWAERWSHNGRKKRNTGTYTAQLQAVVDKFQEQVRELVTETTATDELAALRQKLVETNQKLAKQQTEMLALQEREARHALPEAQRVKWQLVSHMRKSVLQIDCKAACKAASTPVKKTGSLSFEERLDGLLGWNLREAVVQAGVTYTVSVADAVHVKYMRTEEALVVSWTLCVKDSKK
ncbi:hypothetical protein AM588_10002318 [Phytophthora nicotianae]|uniref:PDZ domain-containing protein n=1 Tax=Phytophthora nicotianae TaxID=4792 RepID=A0A0W8D028_PHYNI|nr:hypothetical protein AM588_10002318 [Phytophthora nicotianae]